VAPEDVGFAVAVKVRTRGLLSREALASGEQALSLPFRSTAVTDTRYSVPATSPVSL